MFLLLKGDHWEFVKVIAQYQWTWRKTDSSDDAQANNQQTCTYFLLLYDEENDSEEWTWLTSLRKAQNMRIKISAMQQIGWSRARSEPDVRETDRNVKNLTEKF